MLTEQRFARSAGMPRLAVRSHRGILRIGCRIGLGAAYPAFQLDEDGLRLDLAFVALLLRRRMSDLDACDWLVRRQPRLGGEVPLEWIGDDRPLERVVGALAQDDELADGSDAVRTEWLRLREVGTSRGWTARWDRVDRRAAVPPGV